MPRDSPDYSARSVPGHTSEPTLAFSQPWNTQWSGSLNAGVSKTLTFTISDDSFIYVIDTISVSTSAVVNVSAQAYYNDLLIASQIQVSAVNFPLADNPSFQAINGDHFDVIAKNEDVAPQTITIIVLGTKFRCGATQGHPPMALFTAVPDNGAAPLAVAFTDNSLFTPTSWDWDFGDGSAHSSSQNPNHTFAVAGTYQVKLVATNVYGIDVIGHEVVVT